ncbi:MAG: antibiotic biosynthesis monooxygenase [Saprospiraceae bacterium]|nr:antibiotic biosynthesis monooxygenase [Saprospiraceae bacterium]
MITRIVNMQFRSDELARFLELFADVRQRIERFPGCLALSLHQNAARKEHLFTISQWESHEALEAYRSSELFKNTWGQTRQLFSESPAAWSLEELTDLSERGD